MKTGRKIGLSHRKSAHHWRQKNNLTPVNETVNSLCLPRKPSLTIFFHISEPIHHDKIELNEERIKLARLCVAERLKYVGLQISCSVNVQHYECFRKLIPQANMLVITAIVCLCFHIEENRRLIEGAICLNFGRTVNRGKYTHQLALQNM